MQTLAPLVIFFIREAALDIERARSRSFLLAPNDLLGTRTHTIKSSSKT